LRGEDTDEPQSRFGLTVNDQPRISFIGGKEVDAADSDLRLTC